MGAVTSIGSQERDEESIALAQAWFQALSSVAANSGQRLSIQFVLTGSAGLGYTLTVNGGPEAEVAGRSFYPTVEAAIRFARDLACHFAHHEWTFQLKYTPGEALN